MSELVESTPSVARPLPDVGITIRPGVQADIPFLDFLQKLHTRQVGWMPTKQFEGKIKLGHVLIAVAATPASPHASSPAAQSDAGVAATEEPVGYLIGNDQYFKRDDVGIIYQMNVLPGKQRGLVGASLLKAQFERSAYGCKLYCCWCAQDIAANRFWEAMGFVPLAFRAGSEKKSRTHIFWQKRIRQGDETTPWWFPSKTAGGSIREDRIVLPIPPGTHWSDAKPLIFPESPEQIAAKALNHEAAKDTKKARTRTKKDAVPVVAVEAPPVLRRNGLTFDIPQPGEVLAVIVPVTETIAKTKAPKPQRVKRTCDPRLVSAARELRDRWLERANDRHPDATPVIGCEKYDVTRTIETRVTIETVPMKRLSAA